MAGELQMYLTQPPILLHQDDGPNYEDVLSQIRSGRSPTWLAYQNGQAVALLGLGPANPSACNVIHDDGTVSVYRAFVREEARGSGIGTALLASAIDWARSNGLARCAVDFEPQNVRGRRFWLRHFDAICQTVLRHIRA
ncbi:MAG: GNAT family N-acetyltransferase [Phycisphaerae bacterium]|nr:GNAT family N-acetyltransferase [Phycisphaerae bacterium]